MHTNEHIPSRSCKSLTTDHEELLQLLSEAVSTPLINTWTFNSNFEEVVNYMAYSKTKCKREECLTKPSTWTPGLKKVPTENIRLAPLADQRRLNCWEHVAPVRAHTRRATQHYNRDFSKGRTHFCDLGDKSHNLILICTCRSLHLGIWCLDFRSNDFVENVNTCFRWTVRSRKSFCFCSCLTTEYI